MSSGLRACIFAEAQQNRPGGRRAILPEPATYLATYLTLGVAAFAASTVAGITGFGGAAILLPVLVTFFGMRDAVPILTLAQLIGNGSRVWFNRKEVSYDVVGWFSFGAVPT